MKIRPLKEQYEIRDELLKDRLDNLLAPIMKETGIDLWLIPSMEYNEDMLLKLLTPMLYPTARRITMLVLYYDGEKLHRYAVAAKDPALEGYYECRYDRSKESCWEALIKILDVCPSKVIGLNYSPDYAFGDGLSKGMFDSLMANLPEKYTSKFTSANELCIRYMETRSEKEKPYFAEVMDAAMDIIKHTYSREVIIPGKTTCADLEWAMMQQVNDKGLEFWFPPTIDAQRAGKGMFSGDEIPLEEGDMIHCDFGIVYLGLCTDTQRLGYILKEGETEVPEGLRAGKEENNRFQDIVCSYMEKNMTGNEILTASLKQAAEEGIDATLYTHPIGYYGHGPGPTIGLYDNQKSVPVKGERTVNPDTAYALELNTKRPVEGYEGKVVFFTEETVLLSDGKVGYLAANRDEIMKI
ncbi:MAG: M24 family metallopeptidase [Eubacteriaceae bacterium]|nr:M24 family metallopeptidase [Eubacteriaceae bacterium]